MVLFLAGHVIDKDDSDEDEEFKINPVNSKKEGD